MRKSKSQLTSSVMHFLANLLIDTKVLLGTFVSLSSFNWTIETLVK
jgi:hypothetical protein